MNVTLCPCRIVGADAAIAALVAILTGNEPGAETDEAKFVSPLYFAVTEFAPKVSALVVRKTCALIWQVTEFVEPAKVWGVPSCVEPSKKVIVPVGVFPQFVPVRFADKLTGLPNVENPPGLKRTVVT